MIGLPLKLQIQKKGVMPNPRLDSSKRTQSAHCVYFEHSLFNSEFWLFRICTAYSELGIYCFYCTALNFSENCQKWALCAERRPLRRDTISSPDQFGPMGARQNLVLYYKGKYVDYPCRCYKCTWGFCIRVRVKASFLCFKVQCHLHNHLNLINLSRE